MANTAFVHFFCFHFNKNENMNTAALLLIFVIAGVIAFKMFARPLKNEDSDEPESLGSALKRLFRG